MLLFSTFSASKSLTIPPNYQGQSVDAIDQVHQVQFNWKNKYFVEQESFEATRNHK